MILSSDWWCKNWRGFGIIVVSILYSVPVCFGSWFLGKPNNIEILSEKFLSSNQRDIVSCWIFYMHLFFFSFKFSLGTRVTSLSQRLCTLLLSELITFKKNYCERFECVLEASCMISQAFYHISRNWIQMQFFSYILHLIISVSALNSLWYPLHMHSQCFFRRGRKQVKSLKQYHCKEEWKMDPCPGHPMQAGPSKGRAHSAFLI